VVAVLPGTGSLPRDASDLELVDIPTLARQLKVTAPTDGALPVAERTAKRLRSDIRARYRFREANVADAEALTEWLRDQCRPPSRWRDRPDGRTIGSSMP
jgi:hypothetical protein